MNNTNNLKKIKELSKGYAIIYHRQFIRYGWNCYVYNFSNNLEEAKYLEYTLERHDRIPYIIIDLEKREIIYE